MDELSDLLGDLFCTNSHSLSEDMRQKIFSLLDEDKVCYIFIAPDKKGLQG